MGSCTWWLAIALCFSALAASKGNGTTEPPVMPFDEHDPPVVTMFGEEDPPMVTMFGEQDPPLVTMFDEEAKDDDENEVTEDDEGDTELPSRDFMDTNPTEVEGEPIFEGDILLTQSQWREIRERKGLNGESSRWPEGSDGYPLVPYLFTDSRLDTDTIKKGMDHWMEHTCIKFEETTNTNQPHLQYIYGGGCYSYVGKLNRNGQPVSIGSGCNYLGIVAHEIGHAIGFYHEQSRPDRDDYVVINYENIQDNRESNFNKYSTSVINNQNILYDYSSDMHYGSTGFSINGKTTISTKDHLAQVLIGQRAGLSHRDKHLANIMYKCIDKWLAKCEESTDPCQNGGYYGEACKCVCPPGTSGSNCETETGGYYDSLRNSCTQKVTEEGTLTSPNHPDNYPSGPEGQCVKWIQAPECHVPKLTFSAFELYGKNPYCSGNTCCYFDALEIRTDNLNYGEVFCGTDIAPGRSFTTTGQEMILYFRTRSNRYTGWSADLTFEKQEGCEEPQTTEASATEEGSTVSTTEAFSPQCTLEYYNGVYYWSSPDFGDENYPNSFTCGVTGNADPAKYALDIKLDTFKLQGEKDGECVDNLVLQLASGEITTLCGVKSGSTITSPTFNFQMQFTSDEAITDQGFNISIRIVAKKCNKVLYPGAGEKGTITASRHERMCDYRIVAPAGSEVRIDEISPKILRSPNCRRDWLTVNGRSERMYPKETSSKICGSSKLTSPITSTSGEMYIAYRGSRKSQGFTLKYTIV
ncbi:blastula protease 10-like [Scylla paramamosain]|uniref:blastula protease 10-like n=1 Tax=Scylla paramamosain TaxID=85552 RepID=UPI00308325EB